MMPQYFQRVASHFGWKLLLTLMTVYIFVKGFVMTVVTNVQLPYYKALKFDGNQYQTFSVVALTPFAMKGFIGAVSDSMAICGYHKRYYMIGSVAVGTLAVIALALLPAEVAKRSVVLSPFLFFCAFWEVATLDLLCEGKYAEFMRKIPESRSDILTFVWFCIGIGSVVAASLVGPVADRMGPKPLFWACVPLTAIPVVPLCLGFLPEQPTFVAFQKVSTVETEATQEMDAPTSRRCGACIEVQTERIASEKATLVMASASALSALGLAICGLVSSELAKLLYAIIVSTAMCALAFVCLPVRLATCNLYMFLQEALYINFGGVLDYWYTASGDCVTDGPSFDLTYYQTFTGLFGILASGISLLVFQAYLSSWPFRRIFWVSTLIKVAASAGDLLLVQRINRKMGVPDKAAYFLGDAILLPAAVMINFIPAAVLTSKLCPENVESTVYAILAGFGNFGSSVAKSVGVFLTSVTGVKTTPPNCDFQSLPWLLFLGHGLLPLICIPLTFCLIPAARLDASLSTQETSKQVSHSEPTSAPHAPRE